MASPAHEIAQQPVQTDVSEEDETSTKATASAGLNLNVFGAVSGLFSGKSDEETEADGSSREEIEEQAHLEGAGAGNLNAHAAANAEERESHTKQLTS